MSELRRACEHGRFAPHGGCGLRDCVVEHWYTDPQPDQNGLTPRDRATFHETPQKGHWADPGFEYSPLYWEPCRHEPRCPGGVPVAADAVLIEDREQAIERMGARWYGPRAWASFDEKQKAACRQPLSDLLAAAEGRET